MAYGGKQFLDDFADASDDVIEKIISNPDIVDGWMNVKKWDKDKIPDKRLYVEYFNVYSNPKYYDQITGKIHWPENHGFVSSTINKRTYKKNTIFDRFGDNKGEYLGNPKDSYEARSLAVHSKNAEHHYYRLLEDVEFTEGKIAPWFDQPGGGTQYLKYRPDGNLYSIREMEKLEWIEDITEQVLNGTIIF